MKKREQNFNFYAVQAGRKTGIFCDWLDCAKSVNKFPGNIFKGFTTIEEAGKYLSQSGSPDPIVWIGHRGIPLSQYEEESSRPSTPTESGVEESKMESPAGTADPRNSDNQDTHHQQPMRRDPDQTDPKEAVARPACTVCREPDTNHMIMCNECKGWIHFKCTQLPPYQIERFKNTSRKYECMSCVGDVSQPMIDNCHDILGTVNHNEQLRVELKTTTATTERLQESNEILTEQNNLLTQRFQEVEDSCTRKVNTLKAKVQDMETHGTSNPPLSSEDTVKLKEDIKKRDKMIADLKKTQKCNENRIHELREELSKIQGKSAQDQTHITILRDNLASKPQEGIHREQQTCTFYMRGNCMHGDKCKNDHPQAGAVPRVEATSHGLPPQHRPEKKDQARERTDRRDAPKLQEILQSLKVIQESQLKLTTRMGKLEKTQENPLTKRTPSHTEGITCRHYMKGNCHYGTACRFVHRRHNPGNDTRSSHPEYPQGNRRLNTYPRHTDNRDHPVDTRHRSDRHRSNDRYRDTDRRDTDLSNRHTRQQPHQSDNTNDRGHQERREHRYNPRDRYEQESRNNRRHRQQGKTDDDGQRGRNQDDGGKHQHQQQRESNKHHRAGDDHTERQMERGENRDEATKKRSNFLGQRIAEMILNM